MSARELSPRVVASLLEPEWRFDSAVLGGRGALHDVFVWGNDRVVIELMVDGRPLRIATRPVRDSARRVAGGLAIEWMQPGPREAGDAAASAVARILGAKLDASTRWTTPRDAALQRPDALEHESRPERASLDDDPDRSLLALDAAHYARLFGARTLALRLPGAPGISIHHPPPSPGTRPSGALYVMPERFHRRTFRRYFGRLGFAYDDGTPRTVPTPSTFAAASERALGSPAPWQPRLERGVWPRVTSRSWAWRLVHESVLPVAVAPRWAVELHRALRAATASALSTTVDVGILAHDVSLHALGLHAVDPSFWDALIRRARAKLARRTRARACAVADFFESTLTRTAWEVWKEVETPADFRAAFARHHAALEGELERA